MLSEILKTNMHKNRDLNDTYHQEYQYLNLINDILKYGSNESGRNGSVKMIFGTTMEFNLANNTIPILTTKKVAFKTCLRELLWFINGSTDNKILKDQGVKIWNANSSRDFLDSRGLYNNEIDDLGPIYGFQWRHFNADYSNCHDNYSNKGIDQLNDVINNLKNPEERSSRRLLIIAWNPCQLDKMALPPCHVLMQFNVKEGKYLSCSLYQRSGDVGLGVPFNITSYSFLTHLLAHHCDLIPDKFVYNLGNAHIYESHLNCLESQVKNIPHKFPTITINNKYDNIDSYTVDDFIINNYSSCEKIKMEMIE